MEKEAHARTHKELEELKGVLAGKYEGTPAVGCQPDQKSPTVPSTGTVPVYTTDSDTPQASISTEVGTSAEIQAEEDDSGSPIAKRVRNEPRTRHPSTSQISPYVNPVRQVYQTRKRRCCPPREEPEQTEVNKVPAQLPHGIAR